MHLSDLWLITPDWIFWPMIRWLGLEDTMHKWLCEAWGCRCG